MARGDQGNQTPPVETQPPPAPPAEPTPPAEEKEPAGATYHGDGDLHFGGVPKRDLTVHELLDLEPATFNTITAPNPGTGDAVYRVTKAGESAWAERWPATAKE